MWNGSESDELETKTLVSFGKFDFYRKSNCTNLIYEIESNCDMNWWYDYCIWYMIMNWMRFWLKTVFKTKWNWNGLNLQKGPFPAGCRRPTARCRKPTVGVGWNPNSLAGCRKPTAWGRRPTAGSGCDVLCCLLINWMYMWAYLVLKELMACCC